MKKQLACFAVLCELCANVSLFLERIPIAQSSQRTAKLAKKLGFGVVSKEDRPYTYCHMRANYTVRVSGYRC
jgi:uroporphyrinogen-III synthase